MKKLFLIVTFISFNLSLFATVWINEFMQSNIDLVRDDLNDFPDSWVELYNDSDQPVNINRWYLSIKDKYSKGWKFNVDTVIPAKGYLLIYCDKAEVGLHTSFRLESGKGCDIYLFDSGGKLLDKVVGMPKQPAPNVACGRIEDGNEEWVYFVKATPGEANTGDTATELLPSPLFSIKGGIFKSEVKVSLSLPAEVSEDIRVEDIYFTTDGSEPTEESDRYSTELTFTESTPLRAKVIKEGYLINRSVTQSYIITDRDLTLPIVSINLDPEYLWNGKFGIYVKGDTTFENPNYTYNWRRPMNLEFFPSEKDNSVLNQEEELRISGNVTRVFPQKSLILYANKRFGEKRYNYQLFPHKKDQEIKSFMIRSSGNDFGNTSFRDAAIQLFMGGKVNLDYQDYQPVILFMNGEYFGIQNLRERSDEDFILANYDGLEDIDMIEWWGEVKAGDNVAYNLLKEKIDLPADKIKYEEIASMVDIDEYINYMILEIFVANTDFPHNNVILWRAKDEGKWRFIAKDLDHGLGLYTINKNPDFNAMEHNTTPDDRNRRLFNVLLSQDSFKKDFYNRFAIYLGDILSTKATVHIVDSLKNLVEEEMPYHIDRWLKNWSSNSSVSDMDGWYNEVGRMTDWLTLRPAYMYEHLNSHFNLKGLVPMKVITPDELQESLHLEINGIKLNKPSFDGNYFLGEKVSVKWLNDISGIQGWCIESIVDEEVITTDVFENEVEYVIPANCRELKFSLLTNRSSNEELDSDNIKISVISNHITLSGLRDKSDIMVYDMSGRKVIEKNTIQPTFTFPINQNGTYIVRINNTFQNVSKKIIVY